MTGIESLSHIKDADSVDNIKEITQCFVSQVNPLQVILFGSFANGTYTDDSDYDFYIVVDDAHADAYEQTVRAYKAIRHARTRPVDILVGTNGAFEQRRHEGPHTIENEVYRKGILLYDATMA